MATEWVYESEDGYQEAVLTLPQGYSAPEELKVPLLPAFGSGYELFTKTGINTVTVGGEPG